MHTLTNSTQRIKIQLILLLLLVLPAFPTVSLAATLPTPTLTAEVQSGPQVRLSWQLPGSSVSGFELQRSLEPATGYATILTASRTILSSLDKQVLSGQGYYYRMRCYGGGFVKSYSAFSPVVFADVPPAAGTAATPLPGSFQFAAAAYTVAENAGGIDVVVNRVGGTDRAVTVDFRTGLMTARNGLDYVGIPATPLSFAAGQQSKVVRVGIIADTLAEPDETFKVLLSNPTGGATLGSITQAIITITNVSDAVAPTASITSPAAGAAIVAAGTVAVTATAQDNVGVSRVEFYDGNTLKATDSTVPYAFDWAVTIADNGTHNLQARAYDAAGNVTGSSIVPVNVSIAPPVPRPGSFEFAVGAYTVGESGGYVDVTINRTGGSDGAVSVDFRTGLMTARSGEDYVGIPLKSLTFANGETWKTERVSIINDSVQESEETFKVLLSNPSAGATLGTIVEAIITVLDDDTAAPPPPPVVSGPVKVFPGAQGFGTDTPAGRGGQIIRVTNLNDSGAGSLRAAILASGPRIVVFEVGGKIELQSKLYIDNPFITIAGQTAPFPGIQLKNAGIYVRTHDVLIQHLRIRPGDADPGIGALTERHALAVQANAYNVVIDHNTLQWATDENAAIWSNTSPIRDVTFSNNLIPECLVGGSYGMAVGTNVRTPDFINNISIIGNLFAHNTERQPKIASNVRAIVANNLAYNGQWGFTVVGSAYGPSKASFHANHYISGSANANSPAIAVAADAAGSRVFLDSGLYQNKVSGVRALSVFTDYAGGSTVTVPPVVEASITVAPVADVRNNVLGRAGAWPAFRDTAEAHVITDVSSEIGALKNSLNDTAGWPSSYNTPTTRSLAPYLPANPNGDDNGNGYTNIEEVLYQFARQVEGR